MNGPPPWPGKRTTGELRALEVARRSGKPFLGGVDAEGHQVLFTLAPEPWRRNVGRKPESDIALTWDVEVSRAHALLELVGDRWTLVDDGLSSNGSYVNSKRVVSRTRLHHDDRLCFGDTHLWFQDPGYPESEATRRDTSSTAVPVTPTQHAVLVALCRPLHEQISTLTASNKQIAAEVILSVDAVKQNMRTLFERFGIGDLAQNEKRAALAQKAFSTGTVRGRDF